MLSEAQIRRYARHVLLRQVGGVGQERLLRSVVRVEGSGRALGVAAVYLVAGGTPVDGALDVADLDFLGDDTLASLGPVEVPAAAEPFGILASEAGRFLPAQAGVYVGPAGLAFRSRLGCFHCFERLVAALEQSAPTPAAVLLGSAAALAVQRLVLDLAPTLGALALEGTHLDPVPLPPCEHRPEATADEGCEAKGRPSQPTGAAATEPCEKAGSSAGVARSLGWLLVALALGGTSTAGAESGASPRGSLGVLVEGGVDARASAEGGGGATDNGWFGGVGLGATWGVLDNLELKLLARWSPVAGAPLAVGAGVRNGHQLGAWRTFFDLELAASLGRPATLGPRIGIGLQVELHPLVSTYALAATHFGLGTGARIIGELALGLQLKSYLFE